MDFLVTIRNEVSTRLNQITSLWQWGIEPMGEKKRVLLIQCHPVPGSFSAACARAATVGLMASGHEVRIKCLYSGDGHNVGPSYGGLNFPPALTTSERSNYHTIADPAEASKGPEVAMAPEVAEAVADLRWCQSLVLVYPTWWFNVPGTLKGFLDRTFLPHVAFRLPKQMRPGDTGPTETGLQPLLTNIERVGVISTYGASELVVTAAGDNGRRMLSHGLRPLFAPRCTLNWLGLYEMDSTSQAQREEFLSQIEETYRRF